MQSMILQLKKFSFKIFVITLFIPFIPFSTLQAETVQAETAQTPEQLVTDLIQSLQENNAEKIHDAFSSNAIQLYDRFWAKEKTGEKFRKWLNSDIINPHGRVENAKITSSGSQVVVKGQYVNDNGYSSPADFLFEVNDGKIIRWTIRYD